MSSVKRNVWFGWNMKNFDQKLLIGPGWTRQGRGGQSGKDLCLWKGNDPMSLEVPLSDNADPGGGEGSKRILPESLSFQVQLNRPPPPMSIRGPSTACEKILHILCFLNILVWEIPCRFRFTLRYYLATLYQHICNT